MVTHLSTNNDPKMVIVVTHLSTNIIYTLTFRISTVTTAINPQPWFTRRTPTTSSTMLSSRGRWSSRLHHLAGTEARTSSSWSSSSMTSQTPTPPSGKMVGAGGASSWREVIVSFFYLNKCKFFQEITVQRLVTTSSCLSARWSSAGPWRNWRSPTR